jgi:competence protein ComFB
MAYHNVVEEAVISELDSILEQAMDMCPCNTCREDIVAYVLNRIPPKYVVHTLGATYAQLDQLKLQFRADIAVQLTLAANIVRTHPRHTERRASVRRHH